MKTFREFIDIAENIWLNEVSGQGTDYEKAWDTWKSNPENWERFKKSSRYSDVSKAAKDFMKSYHFTGKPPEWAQFTKDVDTAKSSASKGSTQSTQTPPRGTQTRTETPPKGAEAGTQAPPRGTQASSGSTPPPSGTKTPSSTPKATSGGLSTVAKPSAAPPKGPGLRSRLGKVAGPAVTAGLEYKDRRDAGQSKSRAAGGALSSLAGYAKGAEYGAKLGAKLPIPAPMWVKAGAGGLIGGVLGQQGASAAYDFAADKTRPARQAISKATGFDKFQQKNELMKNAKPGQGLKSLARAQQTVDTRSARAASSAYGTKKGSALTGIGGNTFVSKDKKGAAFMSTGAGSQRKTVQLAKTQLVRDPKTGKQVVGDLAFKGGKAVYLARPSVSSRDTSLGARLGRALNIGKYSKAAEQQAAKQEYRTALKNTQAYTKKLGISTQSATKQGLPGYGGAKPAPKPSTKSAQAYAASKGKYYSSTTGKTYANYAAALKDPSVKAAASKK